MQRYNPKEIEPKWQQTWDEQQTYKADLHSSKPKYVGMSMFNYPSGAGIHIGHAMNYTISDVKARFMRQRGFESYHPVGWDAFGLPAENYAIKAGVSPQASMAKIIPSYHKQYKAMGWSNDWSKEIATHQPEYYKWTQWIFSQMYKHGLAYQDSRMQWWCEADKTVLSNEQVIDGKCWRHDSPEDPLVAQKEVKQWFFKITEYADELLDATDDLDWTEAVKTAQKNWIGKSKGAEIDFQTEQGQKITVFTTRPDTLFGATFIVLAPEHDTVSALTTEDQKQAVEEYTNAARLKSELERQAGKEKTGVFTGAYVINPVNNAKIPVWIADYVLPGYGTGAIMAVPAHDERDNEFAQKFDLEIKEVVAEYLLYEGKNAPRDDIETLKRPVVDAIICNVAGEYLLIDEGDGHVHFVGGGIDEGENEVTALLREVAEESGYVDIKTARPVTRTTSAYAYRHTKQKNQLVWGKFYEVVLASDKKVHSEIDDGKHTSFWVNKAEVAKHITWQGHLNAWQQYLEGTSIHHDEGLMINSGVYDRLESSEARERIVADLADRGVAQEKVNYKMRDWSVSRQRYWGAPIPIVYCKDCGTVPVPDDQLPVVLPELKDFQPSGDGRSALARATDWLHVDCPKCGGEAERETDTLDTYICSSWYMFRYFDPANTEQIFDSEIVNKWAPIDFYNGGDHATAHLLYARFVTRFFTKIGIMENPEPFKQMLFNGKVMASDGSAFSKSKGNGIDPLEIIESGYGADALRTYLMFAAPLEFSARWDANGVPGTYRFLSRVWNLVQEYIESADGELDDATTRELRNKTHNMIKKVTGDLHENRYNTAIATAMGTLNDFYKIKATALHKNPVWQESLEALVCCIAPFAPHIAEQLWHDLGHADSVHVDHWPEFNEAYVATDRVKIVVQVNGKLRGTVEVAKDTAQDDAIVAAKALETVKAHLDGEPKRIIFVPNKLLNFVV